MPVLVPDFGEDINLREAEIYDRVRSRVSSINVAAGTVALDVVTFSPDDPFEILAVGLRALTTVTHDAVAIVPPRAEREQHEFEYQVTLNDTFLQAGSRMGDYFSARRNVIPSTAFDTGADGAGGIGDGITDEMYVIMDPGLDSAESPLVMAPEDELRVHKRIVQPGISADEEALQTVELEVWGEEIEGEETEVRTSFPSREGLTI